MSQGDNHYADRQAQKDAQAAREYAALEATLSPEVRAVLEDRSGRITTDERYIANQRTRHVEELPIGETPDMAKLVDKPHEILAEQFGLSDATALELMRWHQERVAEEAEKGIALRFARTLGVLLRVKNLKLEVHALAFATGTSAANGLVSMTASAREITGPRGTPVTRAAVSKRANWWLGFLELPPNPFMKSNSAVKSYRTERKVNHWRRPGKAGRARLKGRLAKI